MRLPILAFATATALSVAAGAQAAIPTAPDARNVVLLQGSSTSATGWQQVSDVLTKDGYRVTVVHTGAGSLSEDVAMTRSAVAQQRGAVVLVGHSSDGMVITQAGNDPSVVGLVYVAALVPDAAETVPVPGPGATASAARPVKPSVYLIAPKDEALSEQAQRAMARRAGSIVVELSGNQPIYASTPVSVAKVIEQGAQVQGAVSRRAKPLARSYAQADGR